jgi:predicted ATP-binding protein involved in virulence
MKQIEHMLLTLPHTGEPIDISLKGHNLIITGGNGCGKTSFIKQLHDDIIRKSDSKKSLQNLTHELQYAENEVKQGASNQNYNHYQNRVSELLKEIDKAKSTRISMRDNAEFIQEYSDKHFALSYYKAERQSEISVDDTRPSLQSIKTRESSKAMSEHFGVVFEKYLVAQKVIFNDIVATDDTKAQSQADRIQSWLYKVEHDLRYLFEDDELELKFNREKQSFEIHQADKSPFQFNELSSGFSAIMYIYSDLLMKVELKDIPADQLKGIVLIDEIDAHLHVSLQRRILSFFTLAFPNIQFIVTTHSPFVVQSVNDAVIYDLSKREQLEDLSMYSYESILKGLLGVESTSDLLKDQLDEMAQLVNETSLNKKRLNELIVNLEPHEAKLDARSRAFLLLGKNAILDSNDGEE